jgi:hypothetical protein
MHDLPDAMLLEHADQTRYVEQLALNQGDAVFARGEVAVVANDGAPAHGQSCRDVAAGEAQAASDHDHVHAVPSAAGARVTRAGRLCHSPGRVRPPWMAAQQLETRSLSSDSRVGSRRAALTACGPRPTFTEVGKSPIA